MHSIPYLTKKKVPDPFNSLRIGVLHYHFLRGGVRTVITNALRALIAHGGYDSLEIDLIASDAQGEQGNELAAELLDWARACSGSKLRLNQIELSEAAYNSKPALDRDSLFDQARHISERLLEIMELDRCDFDHPYILHVHNGNLGKNPYLTLALKLLSERLERENLPAWILYQMHDFAEDNRPKCWKSLRDCSGRVDSQLAVEMMYPSNSRVRWVCINSADKEVLIATGLGADSVSILPNCVAVDVFTSPPLTTMPGEQLKELRIEPMDFAADLKKRLARFAQKEGFHFDPCRKILLSPIKAIRRKNVAESVLLMMALNARQDEYQLLVTLPAYSDEDVAYCRKIEQFVKENHLPVVIGFGEQLLQAGHRRLIKEGKIISYSLIDLMAVSEAVVTTSIQEGFGYFFHEPWLAGRLVFGRDIPHLTRDFREQGLNLDHLYAHLLIPLEWLGRRWDYIRQSYTNKVQELYDAVGIRPPHDCDWARLIEEKKIYELPETTEECKKTADWADLNLDSQLHILQLLAKEPALFDRVLWTNTALKPISDWFPIAKSRIIRQNSDVVSAKYNLENQAYRLDSLFGVGNCSLNIAGKGLSVVAITNKPILERSLEPANIRLLA